MPLMERFANPDTFGGLDMGDKLMGATITMVIGMGITFTVLFLLWFLISMMGRIMKAADSRKQPAMAEAAAGGGAGGMQSAAAAEGGTPVIDAEGEDPDELIAVITAAITAAEAERGGTSRLVVRSIKRTGGSQNSWAKAGIEDCARSRKI